MNKLAFAFLFLINNAGLFIKKSLQVRSDFQR